MASSVAPHRTLSLFGAIFNVSLRWQTVAAEQPRRLAIMASLAVPRRESSAAVQYRRLGMAAIAGRRDYETRRLLHPKQICRRRSLPDRCQLEETLDFAACRSTEDQTALLIRWSAKLRNARMKCKAWRRRCCCGNFQARSEQETEGMRDHLQRRARQGEILQGHLSNRGRHREVLPGRPTQRRKTNWIQNEAR